MKQTPRAPHVADALADLAEHTGTDPGTALASRLDALAALGEGPAPTPTGDLAVLLSGATPLAARGTRRRRAAALTAGAVVLALVAGTGAAAADVLPERVQRAVAVFSEHFLPFQLPRPHPAPPVAPGAPSTPAPTPAGRSTILPGVGPRPGAPSPLPGHRATSAPTTVPAPQQGRSSAPSTRPAEPAPTQPVAPAPTVLPLPTHPAHPSHPAAPATPGARSGSAGSHRGGVAVRPEPGDDQTSAPADDGDGSIASRTTAPEQQTHP